MLGRSITLKASTDVLGLVNDKPVLNESKFPSHISGFNNKKNLLNLMMSLRSGVCGGVRVRLGRLTAMINTANIQSLDFLVSNGNQKDKDYWHHILKGGDNPIDSMVSRMPESEDLPQNDSASEGAPLTPRKKSMKRIR